MSKYLAYPLIVFKSRELLIGALADVGYIDVEEGQDLPLFGYHGDQRPETAALVVRRQHIGPGSNDLGFARGVEGYVRIISDFDHRTLLGRQFLPRLRVAYAERVVETVRKRLRASVRRTTEGSIVNLHVRYWLPMPEVEFTIDTATGELQMHVQGVAGPGCDDVAKLVKDLAGESGREDVTAEYHLRPRVHRRPPGGGCTGARRRPAPTTARTELRPTTRHRPAAGVGVRLPCPRSGAARGKSLPRFGSRGARTSERSPGPGLSSALQPCYLQYGPGSRRDHSQRTPFFDAISRRPLRREPGVPSVGAAGASGA